MPDHPVNEFSSLSTSLPCLYLLHRTRLYGTSPGLFFSFLIVHTISRHHTLGCELHGGGHLVGPGRAVSLVSSTAPVVL